MTLFLKECKKVLVSLSFLIFVAAIIAFSFVQEIFPSFTPIAKPLPNQAAYGMQAKELPEVVMPAAIDSLLREFCVNQYVAYPIGFYKNVAVSEQKQQKIADSLPALSGLSTEEIMKIGTEKTGVPNGQAIEIGDGKGLDLDENGNSVVKIPDNVKVEKAPEISKLSLLPGLTYESFKKEMTAVDKVLGGGSKYSDTFLLHNFGQVPISYEEALEEYEAIKNTDKFTAAYARLFCDYIGLMLGLLPVFVAVALCLKDRHSKISELIYTRKTSALNIIASRYLALIAMIMLPIIILSYAASITMWSAHPGEALDYLVSLKYALCWLLPSVMISTAVGMFFTVLTDTPIAIAIQSLWWFVDINAGISRINGGYLGGYPWFRLSPRHNIIGNTTAFTENFGSFILNRSFFAAISIALVLLTVYIYDKKRKGHFNGYEQIKSFFFKKKGTF